MCFLCWIVPFVHHSHKRNNLAEKTRKYRTIFHYQILHRGIFRDILVFPLLNCSVRANDAQTEQFSRGNTETPWEYSMIKFCIVEYSAIFLCFLCQIVPFVRMSHKWNNLIEETQEYWKSFFYGKYRFHLSIFECSFILKIISLFFDKKL